MRALILGLTLAALCPAPAPAQQASVVIVSPQPDDLVSGPVVVSARVQPPGSRPVKVTIYADGRHLCTLDKPPLDCAWDAGVSLNEHEVRVVATFEDGSRAVAKVRTKGMGYVEAVDVRVIQVPVVVTDGGRFVRGLTRKDFLVREDDVPQQVSYFAAEDSPLEVVVAVDVSGSMVDAIPMLKLAVKQFLTALRPTDRVTVLGFNDMVFTLAKNAVDMNERLAAIDELSAWGGTAMYDAAIRAIGLLSKRPGRKALVMFTDGEDRVSRMTEERLKKALVGAVGMKQEALSTMRLGVAETVRAAKGDTYAWRQIVLRECRVTALQPVPAAPSAACSGPGYEPECPCLVQDRIKSEVQAYANLIRIDADRQVQGLLDLLSALRSFTGPKLVVVVSQGIVLDEMSFSRGALAAMAGLANARVHVLRPEMSVMDASSGQAIQQRTDDIRLVQDGLDTLAGMLGGHVYPAIGDPQRQFARIWQENAASWRLGVDPEPSDLDGKPHRLDVRVRRAGLSVLARSYFLPDPSARDAATPAGRLRDALFSPVQATTLPVRATHYVMPASGSGEFQVRIVGEIDGVPAKADPPQVAFVVADERGKQITGGAGRVADEPDGVHPGVFSTLVKLQAGRYMIKLAAATADGRVGSIERHFELTPAPAGALALGDLMLAEYAAGKAGMVPGVRPIVTNGQLAAYAEIARRGGAAAPAGLVELQIAPGPGEPLLVSLPVSAKPAISGDLDVVSAVVSVVQLGDGEYVARLVAPSSAPPAEGGWRTFRVATDAAAVLDNSSLVAPFDRRSVLAGDLMARALAELADRPAAADPAIAAALKDLQAARFASTGAAMASEEDPATPAMIRGFGLLAGGQLDDAASEFKAAVREAPDLSLALVYVGSCFAAGGLDREAAGAWQTALIEERNVPVLYTLLADAWLRLNDPARALEVLTRAATRWPGDADLKRRRAVALARAGRRAEALSEVDALLAAAPDDVASACIGFRIAVDRSMSGAVTEEKRRTYARACASGGAPESPLAAGWLKAPGRKGR